MNKGTLFKPLPQPNIDDWQSDAAFVKHFLEGANPMVSKSFRFLFLLIRTWITYWHTHTATNTVSLRSFSIKGRSSHISHGKVVRPLASVDICVVQKKYLCGPKKIICAPRYLQVLRMVRISRIGSHAIKIHTKINHEFGGLTFKVDGREEYLFSLMVDKRWTKRWKKAQIQICWHHSLKRLFVADYSSLASLPIVEGRAFYAPQVLQDNFFHISFFISLYSITGTPGEEFSWKSKTVGNPPLPSPICPQMSLHPHPSHRHPHLPKNPPDHRGSVQILSKPYPSGKPA